MKICSKTTFAIASLSLSIVTFSAECSSLSGNEVSGIPLENGQEKYNAGWSFYFDNDAFTPTNRDKDYTYGLALTFAGRRAKDGAISMDKALGIIDRSLSFSECYPYELHSLQIGVVAFTPSIIEEPDIIQGDRPYASIVYLANGRNYIKDRDSTVYHSSLSVGILGLRVARALQNTLHSALNIDEAEGWDHQISDGGEPTLRYTLARQDLLASNFQKRGSEYEVKASIAGSIGFLTDASASLSMRWGRINTPWWSFPPERVEYIAEPAPVIGGTDIRPGSRELYLWTGIKLRARAYNAFLQGQFRDSELTYDHNDIRPIIGEAWLGVTGQIDTKHRLSWVMRYQSSELKKGHGDREAIWGTIMFSRDL